MLELIQTLCNINNGSDTMTGDAELIAVEVRSAA